MGATNKELDFALKSSQDKGIYPDIFSVEIGSDFHLETRPELYPLIDTPRKVVIEITTFAGLCAGAKHYYAEIKADGIHICSKRIENGKEIVSRHGGYLGEEYKNLPNEKKSIWDSPYSIEVIRPVTQEMINKDPMRWEDCYIGYKTNAFDTMASVLEVAMKIVEARFTKDWVVEVRDLT